jgi:hypothetical protein
VRRLLRHLAVLALDLDVEAAGDESGPPLAFAEVVEVDRAATTRGEQKRVRILAGPSRPEVARPSITRARSGTRRRAPFPILGRVAPLAGRLDAVDGHDAFDEVDVADAERDPLFRTKTRPGPEYGDRPTQLREFVGDRLNLRPRSERPDLGARSSLGSAFAS